MADYKDYIVQYDIRANVANAQTALESLQGIVTNLTAPMKELQTTFSTINSAITSLNQNKNLKLTPDIDVINFNKKLENMVASVEGAATRMHNAIYSALRGDAKATNAVKKSINKALGVSEIEDAKKRIADNKKEIDKIWGKPDKRGNRGMAFNELSSENQAKVNVLKQQNKELSEWLRENEKLTKQTAIAQTKSEKTATKATNTQAAPLTNVTPATIRAWKDVFGNAKTRNLAIKITANAKGPNGAITIINQVKESLEALKGFAGFEINPTLNKTAFQNAETELSKLASLSKSIMAPFTGGAAPKQGKNGMLTGLTKEDQEQLKKEQAAIANYRNKIDKLQSRLHSNEAKLLQDPSNKTLKGLITRDTNSLRQLRMGMSTSQLAVENLEKKAGVIPQKAVRSAGAPLTVNVVGNLSGINAGVKPFEIPVIGLIQKVQPPASVVEIPANVKLLTSQVTEAVKAIPRQSLPVNIKLTWEKGAIGKDAQFKAIQDKVPPIKLVLDASEAKTALTNFIAEIQSKSPQTIKLNANGTTTGTGTGTSSTGGTGSGNKGGGNLTKAQIAQNVKSHNAAIPFVKSQGLLNAVVSNSDFFNKAVSITGINPSAKMSSFERLKLYGEASRQSAKASEKIPWQFQNEENKARAEIAKELERRIERRNNAFAQHKKAKSVTSALSHRNKMEAMRAQLYNSFLPFVNSPSQANELVKYRKYFQKAVKISGITPTANMSSAQRLTLMSIASQKMMQDKVQVPSSLMNEMDKARASLRSENQQWFKEQRQKNDAIAAQAAAQKEARRQQTLARGAARHQIHLAQASNAILPFVQNKEQLNTVLKNWKYFQRAIASTGITPTQGMAQSQMVKYLQGVAQQMQSANVQIPWTLQNTINNLQKQIAKATQAATAAANVTAKSSGIPKGKVHSVRVEKEPQSFYKSVRKWAYPFTGTTSFGERTPMAVDMAKGMGVMFAVGGAMSAVGNSFSQAVHYQNTMKTTEAILKNGTDTYSPEAFRNMERVVRNVGMRTKFSAPEVADAAKFLAMAGFDIGAINNAIQPIANLALIGDTDLGETADKMTNIMTTFGITPEKLAKNPKLLQGFANIMTTTATRSNTDLMMLAESAKYGGGVANMYGKGDPNLFADTMALFGIMGNAGIQASSAGTALRMMYQNIYKPNKNQKAVLDMLNRDYGISTKNEDGSKRSIVDILIDIANNVSDDKMSDVVGSLFRITAQPGAAAVLGAAAQEDGSDVGDVAKGIEKVFEFANDKKGLGALISLIQANRASVSGYISDNIALEKQNTIQGLWAQVTSTFTEGILKAFESNMSKFEGTLGKLRDYLAKPETVELIQKLFDMVVSIGEMMAEFVKIWVWFYEKFEPLVKGWVGAQMFFTQLGSLITPVVSVIGVLDRLRSALYAIAGVEMTATAAKTTAIGSAVANTLSNRTLTAAILGNKAADMMTGGYLGWKIDDMVGVTSRVKGKTSLAAQYQKYKNRTDLLESYIMSRMALQGYHGDKAKDIENRKIAAQNNPRILAAMNEKRQKTALAGNIASQHEEVRARHKRLYHPMNRAGRAFMSTFTFNPFTGLSNWLASLKTLFLGLMLSFSKAIGLLLNPFTLATGAIGLLGYKVYQLGQYANSATEAQINARRKLEEELNQSADALKQRHSDTAKVLAENGIVTATMGGFDADSSKYTEKSEPKNQWINSYKYLANKDIRTKEGASRKANHDLVNAIRARYMNDATMNLILNDEEKKRLIGSGLTIATEEVEKAIGQVTLGGGMFGSSSGTAIANSWRNEAGAESDAFIANLKKFAMLDVKYEGANAPHIVRARKQIAELRKIHGDTERFRQLAKEIRSKVVNINDPNLLSDGYINNLEWIADENSDWSKTKAYVMAGYKALTAEIEGSKGSITSSALALRDIKEKLTPHSQEWNNAVSSLISNFRIINDITFNGETFKNIELLMNTLPNGKLDFSNILSQIQERIKGFTGNSELFFEIANQVYTMLLNLGVEKDKSPEARARWIENMTSGMELSDAEIAKWYKPQDEFEANGPLDSPFYDWERHKQKMARHYLAGNIAGLYKDGMTINGHTYSTGNPNQGGNTPPPPAKQDDYASKYNNASAKPTQIIYNINNLANFDRTTVAANADERDMAQAMESKISEMVYRIFAEAMNNANSLMG